MLLQKSQNTANLPLSTANLSNGYGKFQLARPLPGADMQMKQAQLSLENATKEKTDAMQKTVSSQKVLRAQAFDMHMLDDWLVPIAIGIAMLVALAARMSASHKHGWAFREHKKWEAGSRKMREEDAKAAFKSRLELIEKDVDAA